MTHFPPSLGGVEAGREDPRLPGTGIWGKRRGPLRRSGAWQAALLSLGTPLLGALGEWHFAVLGTLSDAVSTASASWANLQVKARRC